MNGQTIENYLRLKEGILNSELAKLIYNALTRKNSSSLTNESLSKYNTSMAVDLEIIQLLIESKIMQHARMRIINSLSSDKNIDAYWYISPYGGSKTQFLHAIEDIIFRNEPDWIPIFFDSANSLTVLSILNQIINGIYLSFDNTKQQLSKDKRKELIKYISTQQININKMLSEHAELNKITDMFNKLENIIGPNNRALELISEIKELVMISGMGKPDALEQLIKFIITLSKDYNKHIFFLFDEVDEWWNEEINKIVITESFQKITSTFRRLLDGLNSNEIKVRYIFAATPRAFDNLKEISSQANPVISRLKNFIHSDNVFAEPGNYDEEGLGEIIAYFAALYNKKERQNLNFSVSFFEEVYKRLINESKGLTRRDIHNILDNIFNAYKALKLHQKALQEGQVTYNSTTGNRIQDRLAPLLNCGSISFINAEKVKRELIEFETVEGRKRIDGYFDTNLIDSNGERLKLWAEIKLTQKWSPSKLIQCVHFIHSRKNDYLIIVIFTSDKDLTVEKVKEDFHKEYLNYYSAEYDSISRFDAIIINNEYAFYPLVKEHINPSEDYPNLWQWFNFFSDFSSKYRKILGNFLTKGYHVEIRKSPKEKDASVDSGAKTGQKKDIVDWAFDKTEKDVVPEPAPEKTLSPQAQLIYDVLVELIHQKIIKPSGYITITDLNILNNFSLSVYEFKNILKKIRLFQKETKSRIYLTKNSKQYGMNYEKELHDHILAHQNQL